MDFVWHYRSPLGGITLASDGEALTGLWFDDQKRFAGISRTVRREKKLSVFQAAERWLDVYFGGGIPDFTPTLAMRTTPFRKTVWEILLTIPYGETMTYGGIAAVVAAKRGFSKMSAQAIGGAVGHNAVALIVPCHRVIGANGGLVGYGGGLERKARLLALERVIAGKRGGERK